MPSNLTPTVVKQKTFTTDEISKRADPDWVKDRNYLPSYKFARGRRVFIAHRDGVYQTEPEE